MKTNNSLKQRIIPIVAAMVCLACESCMHVELGDCDKTPTQVTEQGKLTAMLPFNEVKVSNGFEVIYTQGDAHSVRVEAGEQAFKSTTIYVKDHELRVRKAVKTLPQGVKLSTVKVYVTSPELQGVEMAGSGIFAATGNIKADELDTEIAGSGKIVLAAVDCRKVDMEIGGSGNIAIGELSATQAKAEIAGSGKIVLGDATCDKVNVEIAGSGNVRCDNLTASDVHTQIAGSGNVTLKGNIARHTEDIAGSGKVNIKAIPQASSIQ